MSKGIVLISFLISQSEASVFMWIMKWGNLINLFTLYKSSIEHNIELLVILLFNATANDMAAKTEKSKVLHYFKVCVNVLASKNNQLQT